MATFSQRLKAMRSEMNLSLRQLSKITDISPSALHSYEVESREPSHKSLEALSDVFNCDINYLLGKSDVRNSVATSFAISSLFQGLTQISRDDIDISSRDVDFMMMYHGLSEETKETMFKLLEIASELDKSDQNAILRLALALRQEQ